MWLFRAFCDEKVRADADRVKADKMLAETRHAAAVAEAGKLRVKLLAANREIARLQVEQGQHDRSVGRMVDAIKAGYQKRIAALEAGLEAEAEAGRRLEAENLELSGRLSDAEAKKASER